MTFTARAIIAGLQNEGWLDAAFVNTGGWVMNVSFTPICRHGVTLGEILASDNGDWGYGDIDEPAESVSVMAYAPDGDPMDDRMWTVEDVRGAVLAFDDLSYALERFCPDCYADHGSVAEFASEHAGHDVRLCRIEVVDVSYYAAAADGTLSTDWDVNDTYNVETRTTDAQCRTCGVIVADVDASAIVVTL